MINQIVNYLKNGKDTVTSISLLLTLLISSISLYYSVRNNKAVHYVNSITKSRIEWIQKLRSTIAEFIANTNIYANTYYNKMDDDDVEKAGLHLSKCQELCSEIRLLLNYCDKKDKEIINLSDEILEQYENYYEDTYNCKMDDDGFFNETRNMIDSRNKVEKDIKELSKKVQIYLKAEWNRVKYESQGKIYEKDTQKFDYSELEKMYDNDTYKPQKWTRFCIDIKAKFKRTMTSPTFVIRIIVILLLLISLALIVT